jgi:UDP-3-O-[3-hydroxymyristoyl] glucosamine N-acyltransferase
VQAEFSLGELAVRFGLTLRGEPGLTVRSVATLSRANPGTLSFLANSRYRRQLESTRATAVILSAEDEAHCPVAALIDPNPYLAYARIAALLHPETAPEPGIHPSAVVAGGARVAASASIGPLAVIEEGGHIGERVVVGVNRYNDEKKVSITTIVVKNAVKHEKTQSIETISTSNDKPQSKQTGKRTSN